MKWFTELLKLLWAYVEVAIKRAERKESEGSSEEKKMTIDFDGIKDAALDALEDANAKEELLDVLKKNKSVFVEEGRGYLEAIVSTFSGNEYNPEKYAEFVAKLSDEQLVEEVSATADEADGIIARYYAKKQFVEDLKGVVSSVVRKAVVAGLTAYVGPAAGPIAGFVLGR